MYPSKNRYSYQLHIQLQDIKPAIWRRVLVADTTTIAQLHRIIQAAMGGVMGQRYVLEIAGQRYGAPNPDLPDDPTMDARRYTIGQLLQGQALSMRYFAGLAGGLQHRIKVEACVPSSSEQLALLPECIAGRSPCPPYNSEQAGNCFDLLAARQRVQALFAAPKAPAPGFSASFIPKNAAHQKTPRQPETAHA